MSQEQTREEFLAKKNRFDIPGYTDPELDEYMEACEFKGNPAVKCACCGNFMLAGEICLMCGMDDWQGTSRTERIYYQKMLAVRPEYIWDVDHRISLSEKEMELTEQENIDLKSVLVQVFGKIPDLFTDEELKYLEETIDDVGIHEALEILYRKDFVNLVEQVNIIAGGDMTLIWEALQRPSQSIHFFKDHKKAEKQEYIQFLASLDDWHKGLKRYKNPDVVLEVARKDANILLCCPYELTADANFMLSLIKENEEAVEYVADGLWSDRDFVKEMIKLDAFASPEAKKRGINDFGEKGERSHESGANQGRSC